MTRTINKNNRIRFLLCAILVAAVIGGLFPTEKALEKVDAPFGFSNCSIAAIRSHGDPVACVKNKSVVYTISFLFHVNRDKTGREKKDLNRLLLLGVVTAIYLLAQLLLQTGSAQAIGLGNQRPSTIKYIQNMAGRKSH